MIRYAPPPVGRERARDLARHELRKQIYHRDEPSFLDRLYRRISDWIHSVLDHVPGDHSGGSGSWAALLVLLVILGLIVAAIWWRGR